MARISYAELEQRCLRLKARVKELELAMGQADRAVVGYGVDRWVSIPLPAVQADAVRGVIQDVVSRRAGDGRQIGEEVDGVRVLEMVAHADDLPGGRPLAEYAAYLVRYTMSNEEGTALDRVWALVPV